MERIARGFRLLGASWRVLRADRELLVLPLIAAVATLVFGVGLGGFAWGTGAFRSEELGPTEYVMLGTFMLVASFIAIYANAAVVAAASIRLAGGDPTVSDGLRAARARVGRIFLWAVVTTTVGMILRAIEQRLGFVGRILIGIIGAAWGAVTFFVVPVLVFEDLPVGESIKRSGALFRQRWGEQFVGTGAIGIAMFVLMLPLVVLFGAVASAAPVAGITLLILSVVALGLIGATMNGIFSAALYRYAVHGDAGGSFSDEDLRGSFRERPSRHRMF